MKCSFSHKIHNCLFSKEYYIIVTIKNGNELTQLTRDAFKENVEISTKIGILIDEIAAASQEQSQGIELINKSVAEMDQITQQTAAHSEESASASEEMNAQAEQLKHFVRDLSALVVGPGNGVVAERRSESLGKKLTDVLHINKKALPLPAKGTIAKVSLDRKTKFL